MISSSSTAALSGPERQKTIKIRRDPGRHGNGVIYVEWTRHRNFLDNIAARGTTDESAAPGKGMYEMTPAIMASIIPEAVVTDPGTISAAQVGTVHRQ
jgi:hypothetical protein